MSSYASSTGGIQALRETANEKLHTDHRDDAGGIGGIYSFLRDASGILLQVPQLRHLGTRPLQPFGAVAIQSGYQGSHSYQPDELWIPVHHFPHGYEQAIHLVDVPSRWLCSGIRLGYRLYVVLSLSQLAGKESDPVLRWIENLSNSYSAISGTHTWSILYGQPMECHWSDPQ